MTKEQHTQSQEQPTEPIDVEAFLQQKKPEPAPYMKKDAKTVQSRRSIVKKLQSRIAFPVEKSPATPDAVERAQKMRQEGYAFIVPYSHADRRGPVDVMTTLISMGEGFEDASYHGPLALHQKKPYIDYLSEHADIPLSPIVTPATLEYFKSKEEKPPTPLKKAADIFRKDDTPKGPKLKPNLGLREYIEEAGRVLAEDKGIVFVAPQGGRRPQLGQPAGRAVEMLMRSAEKKGADKIAVWPMGILLKNEKTSPGLNLAKVVNVAFAAPITLEELRQRAEENEQNIDVQIFDEFKKILPPSYVNPKGEE